MKEYYRIKTDEKNARHILITNDKSTFRCKRCLLDLTDERFMFCPESNLFCCEHCEKEEGVNIIKWCPREGIKEHEHFCISGVKYE